MKYGRSLRRWTALALAAVGGALALTGCAGGGSGGQAEGDQLARIQASGEIVIALEGTWAPWSYHDEDDTLTGYDVEVGRLIAQELGVEATFVEGGWDGLMAGLDAGRYDVVINGMGVTEERAEKYDFSTPYAYNRTAVIVRGDNTDIQSMEDLAGKTTANTLASTYAILAESYGATNTGVDDLLQTIELLEAGRIDATLNAEGTFAFYMSQHPQANLKIAAYADQSEQIAIPFRKGEDSASLRQAVDQILEALSQSGQLSELSQQFFGIDISQAP